MATVAEDADATGDGQEGGAGGGGSVRVVVVDETFEFPIDPDVFPSQVRDGVLAGGSAVDADGEPLVPGDPVQTRSVNFLVTPTDWENQGLQEPGLGVDDVANNRRWQAGQVGLAESRIEDWTLDGTRASGTASFLDLTVYTAGGDAVAVAGSFEIDCG